MDTNSDFSFPKQFRLLRSSDFRRAYGEGLRVLGPYFSAFCFKRPEDDTEPRVGFTLPRAVGKAVDRNRIKRRMREAVRHEIRGLMPGWNLVFNPRRTVLKARFTELRREVKRVIRRCNAS